MQLPKPIIDRAKSMFWQNRIRLTDQFGLVEQINSPKTLLPEYLFLGSTNVGKSSLLNSLLSPPRRHQYKGKDDDVPRVSKKAGFTETISLYTVGKLLRLCDSPGYGFKSSNRQGDVVVKYLDSRAEAIRNAYILIHAKRGLTSQDESVGHLLKSYGVPFKCVITKADLGVSCSLEQDVLDLFSDLRVPGNDQLFITSTKTGSGIDELRADLLASSGVLENSK